MHEALLTTAQLAERLQIPARTLDQWAYRGFGPPYAKVGRHRRYDSVDVERWIESRKRT